MDGYSGSIIDMFQNFNFVVFFFFFCHYFLLKTVAKIGNSQGKGEVEIIMKRSSSMPGPHDYFEGLPPQRRTPLKALAKEVGLG
jgi:hypothetical protein